MDLQLLQDTVFFDKKTIWKIIDDILNLLYKEYCKPIWNWQARALILSAAIPDEIRAEIILLTNLSKQSDTNNLGVAVRSSATAEDLPSASFAGQMESFPILVVINYLMLYMVVTYLIYESCYKVPSWYGFYKIRYCDLCWCTTWYEAIKLLQVLPLLLILILVFKIRS
jgi:hypothetical protein